MGRFLIWITNFVFMGKVADLCMLNLLYCLLHPCCYSRSISDGFILYVTLKMVRIEEAYIFRSFLNRLKRNFKQATIINVIMLIVAVLLYLDTNIAGNMGQTTGKILRMIFAVFTLFICNGSSDVYPVLPSFIIP